MCVCGCATQDLGCVLPILSCAGGGGGSGGGVVPVMLLLLLDGMDAVSECCCPPNPSQSKPWVPKIPVQAKESKLKIKKRSAAVSRRSRSTGSNIVAVLVFSLFLPLFLFLVSFFLSLVFPVLFLVDRIKSKLVRAQNQQHRRLDSKTGDPSTLFSVPGFCHWR